MCCAGHSLRVSQLSRRVDSNMDRSHLKKCLCILFLMFTFQCVSSTRITIADNKYSNILFAVSPDVPPENAELIISNIKVIQIFLFYTSGAAFPLLNMD